MHFHKWYVVKDTGVRKYTQCKKCSKRAVTGATGGYQPIDTQWIETGVFNDTSYPKTFYVPPTKRKINWRKD